VSGALAPFALVVMGVSGSGKSTVAAALASRLGWPLVEADTFHSPANVTKMSAGTPLTDEDRWPWLDGLAARIAEARASRVPCVIACSALRRAYRERLAAGFRDVRFVYLQGSFDTIARRMATRTGHYMPATLLASQFATLEPPAPGEGAIVVDAEGPIEAIVTQILHELSNITPS
jgi:carbohydrate kinase (thermoresistant glucokinase family)